MISNYALSKFRITARDMPLKLGHPETFYAPAKINLMLRVIGRREDGYHDLVTWMQKIDLSDCIEMTVYAGSGLEVRTDSNDVPDGEKNLAFQAAKIFLDATHKADEYGVRINIKKLIPAAAGLGGGSSDAGVVLRELNRKFCYPLKPEVIHALAAGLGADVPFFAIDENAVYAKGRGDELYPIDSMDDVAFILVNPDFPVSTEWVFQNLLLTRDSKNSSMSCFRKYEEEKLSLDDMHNDLESVTIAKYVEIDQIKSDLLTAGANRVQMSGSGPTVFGVFPDNRVNQRNDFHFIVKCLRQKYGSKVFLSRACTGASPSGKAPGFDPGIRRFESCRHSHK